MTLRQQLAHDICEAFTTQLITKQIFVNTAGQYFDVDKAIEELAYENWYDVPLSMIIRHRIHIGYLNSIGFHFYKAL